ncbi:hypothetical protein BDV06DRAFT_201152 [Aspergillus oleicola]
MFAFALALAVCRLMHAPGMPCRAAPMRDATPCNAMQINRYRSMSVWFVWGWLGLGWMGPKTAFGAGWMGR